MVDTQMDFTDKKQCITKKEVQGNVVPDFYILDWLLYLTIEIVKIILFEFTDLFYQLF